MFRPRKLLWLVALVGIGFAVWRWRQQQTAEQRLPAARQPAMSPPAVPRTGILSPQSAQPAQPATPATPRRIPTRVHRGAPPSQPKPAAAPAEKAPEPAPVAEEPVAPPEPAPVVEEPVAVLEPAPVAEEPAPVVEEPVQTSFAPEALAESIATEDTSEQAAPATLVNLNDANLETLIALPGIGPSIARQIIAYREANGPFSSIDQLIDIKGIGARNIDEFRHLVTV